MDESNSKTTKESLVQPINEINQNSNNNINNNNNNNNNDNSKINITIKNNNPSTLNQDILLTKAQSNHVTLNLKHEISLEDIISKKGRDIKLGLNARVYENNEKGYNLFEREKEKIYLNTLNNNYDANECLLNEELHALEKDLPLEDNIKQKLSNFSTENFIDHGNKNSSFLNYVNFLNSEETSPKISNSKNSLSNKEKLNNSLASSSAERTSDEKLKSFPSNTKKVSASSNEFDEEDLDDYKDFIISQEKEKTNLNSNSIETSDESNPERKNSHNIFNANPQLFNKEQTSAFIPDSLNSPKSIKRQNPKHDFKLHTELRNLINNQTNLPRVNKSKIKVTIEPTSDSVSLNNEHESSQETEIDRNVSGIVNGGVGSSIKKCKVTTASNYKEPNANLFDKKLNTTNLGIKNSKLANSINLNASTTFLDKESTFLKANNTNKANPHRGSATSNSPLAHVGHINCDDPIEKHAKNCECDNCHLQNEINNEEPKATYSYLKSYFVSMLQPSDNKLAMKLFGSKKGVLKEKLRQQEVGHWIIHPCSNFRLNLFLEFLCKDTSSL